MNNHYFNIKSKKKNFQNDLLLQFIRQLPLDELKKKKKKAIDMTGSKQTPLLQSP